MGRLAELKLDGAELVDRVRRWVGQTKKISERRNAIFHQRDHRSEVLQFSQL